MLVSQDIFKPTDNAACKRHAFGHTSRMDSIPFRINTKFIHALLLKVQAEKANFTGFYSKDLTYPHKPWKTIGAVVLKGLYELEKAGIALVAVNK